MSRTTHPLKTFVSLVSFVAIFPAAHVSNAQTTTAPDTLNPTTFLAPYIDNQTLVIAHLDAAKIDSPALYTFTDSLWDAAKIPADSDLRQAEKLSRVARDVSLARFKQLGGRHIFFLISMNDLAFPNINPPTLLFKIEPGGDAKQMAAFLAAALNEKDLPEIAPGILCLAEPAPFDRLKKITPQPRPDLAFANPTEAFDITAAFTADTRRVISELLPAFPLELGGGSTDSLTRGISNITLSLHLPPQPNLTLTLNLFDPAKTIPLNPALPAAPAPTAADLNTLILRLRDTLLADKGFNDALNESLNKSDADEIRSHIKTILTPIPQVVVGTGPNTQFAAPYSPLKFQITEPQILSFAKILMPSFQNARLSAQRTNSMSTIRHILLASVNYASSHNNAFPESLDILIQDKSLTPDQLSNPADHRPYIYQKPPASAPASTTPVIWEQTDNPNQPLAVGFADGHVELLPNHQKLEALLQPNRSPATTP